jgi:hypothetical protein
MTESRIMFSIFCDDVRAEQGNKLSLMGCYDGTLLVPSFPFLLTKLCVVMHALTPADRPFKELKFRVYKNEDLIAELEMPVHEVVLPPPENWPAADSVRRQAVRNIVQLQLVQLDGPCYFKVRALTEDDEQLKGGLLRVDLVQAPQP